MSKGKNIRVTSNAHEAAIKHVKPKGNVGPWVSEAIYEKIEREKTLGNPVLERHVLVEYGVVDSDNHMYMPGCFDKSLNEKNKNK